MNSADKHKHKPSNLFFMDLVVSSLATLLSVAFFTLLERKMMGLAHYRKGPNKILVAGLSQPISDAVKLLTKETNKFMFTKTTMYTSGPVVGLGLMLGAWLWVHPMFPPMAAGLKMLVMFATMSLMVYSLLLMSWGSNSKYAILGGHRGVAQVVSYEVCFFLFLLVWFFITKSFSFSSVTTIQMGFWGALFCPAMFMVWIMLCLAESNRTPFDMAEGESEIVSGFNIEYGGGLFALIFIAEYGMLILLGFITSVFFLGGVKAWTMGATLLVSSVFVWARCSFPRVRYDLLMMAAWKICLPFSLALLVLSLALA